MNSSKKWYQKSFGIIALLILFFPAGLFLMWKYANWNKYIKIGITAVFALFLLTGAITDDNKEQGTATPADTTVNKPEERPTEKPKPTESAQHELKADIKFSEDAYLITNEDGKVWIDCKLEMNSGIIRGGYVYNTELIDTDKPVIIPFREFTKGDGTRFNSDATKPQSLSISCADVGGSGKRGFGYFGAN